MLEWIIQLDHAVFNFINQTMTNSVFDVIMPAITDLHKTTPFKIIVPIFFVSLFVYKFKLKKGLLLFVGLLLSLGLSDLIGNYGFKKTAQRARPGDSTQVQAIVRSPYGGYSFTSNHAANMFSLATYTSALIPGSAIIVFPIATLIGFSRVYNGVHFPLDVIVGGLLGFVCAFCVVSLFKKILKIKEANP